MYLLELSSACAQDLLITFTKKRVGIAPTQQQMLKVDYEEAYQRLVAGDGTPSTRIIPVINNSFY